MNISMSLRLENSVWFKISIIYFVARDFVDKIKLDKEQQFKSEGEALAYYKDAVKKINQKLFMIIPRDLITAKG